MIRLFITLPLLLLLGACGAAVEYGGIRHSELASHPDCNPVQTTPAAVEGKDHFIVTSRLPDCRGGEIKLTNHRSDKVRFGRFSAPMKLKPVIRSWLSRNGRFEQQGYRPNCSADQFRRPRHPV